MSFLHNSYGHPQVQTVPSTARAAPYPVVTPSLDGLGSAFSVDYFISDACWKFKFFAVKCRKIRKLCGRVPAWKQQRMDVSITKNNNIWDKLDKLWIEQAKWEKVVAVIIYLDAMLEGILFIMNILGRLWR